MEEAAREAVFQDLASSHGEKLDNLSNTIQGVQARVDHIYSKVEEHDGRFAQMEERLNVMELSNAQLKQKLAVAESVDPPARTEEGFDRTPDPTVVKANAKSMVGKDAVTNVVQTHLENANISTPFVVKGDGVGKYFTIRFKGTPLLAARGRLRKPPWSNSSTCIRHTPKQHEFQR